MKEGIPMGAMTRGLVPTHDQTHIHALGDVPMLDIGGDVGAIVVRLAADTATGELYAHPEGAPDRRFHTGVHHRHLDDTTMYVAVFPEVTAGRYHLLHDDGSVWTTLDVVGGEVSEVQLTALDLADLSGS
jgi:hypothetical protein